MKNACINSCGPRGVLQYFLKQAIGRIRKEDEEDRQDD